MWFSLQSLCQTFQLPGKETAIKCICSFSLLPNPTIVKCIFDKPVTTLISLLPCSLTCLVALGA